MSVSAAGHVQVGSPHLLRFFHYTLCGFLFIHILIIVRLVLDSCGWYISQRLHVNRIKHRLCNALFFCFVRVCVLAGWGACGHTSAVRRVAGPRRTRWPLRLPAVHHLDQGEEERWRATNGTLQVTHSHTYTLLIKHCQHVLHLTLLYTWCLFWLTLPALGLDGQVFWSPWKRRLLCWTRVGRCSRWSLSKHWEISEPWWFRPRYRETELEPMLARI